MTPVPSFVLLLVVAIAPLPATALAGAAMLTLALRGQPPSTGDQPMERSAWRRKDSEESEGWTATGTPPHNESQDIDVIGDTLETLPRLYTLRLCNGYAAEGDGLEMRRLEEPRLVEYPLAYKTCKDFNLPLKEGDKLQFKTSGQVDVGTFEVSSLPPGGSVLLLVPHREAAGHILASFESHIFAPSESPQIAVVDAYRGVDDVGGLDRHPVVNAVPPTLHIVERASVHEGIVGALAPGEDVAFNTVIALTPGRYWLSLGSAPDEAAPLESAVTTDRRVAGEGGLQTALREAGREGSDSNTSAQLGADVMEALGSAVQLSAQIEETYVAVRVGDGSMSAYPEEILVFPQMSGASQRSWASLTLAAQLLALFYCGMR